METLSVDEYITLQLFYKHKTVSLETVKTLVGEQLAEDVLDSLYKRGLIDSELDDFDLQKGTATYTDYFLTDTHKAKIALANYVAEKKLNRRVAWESRTAIITSIASVFISLASFILSILALC